VVVVAGSVMRLRRFPSYGEVSFLILCLE
jgi:hypothetical protein